MQIHITSNDGVPIYHQIVHQMKHLVASGRLAPGEELPPIRVLAEQLVVNPNTVARAYLELEHAGVVTKRHGSGTYVAESPPARSRPAQCPTRFCQVNMSPTVTGPGPGFSAVHSKTATG